MENQTCKKEDLATYSPLTDVIENADSIVLLTDLPGVNERDLEISLDKNILTLGAKGSAPKNATGEALYQEFRPVSFERRFALNTEIDRDGIEATVRHGLLRLTLRKAKAVLPRRISVKAG